jgi:hypothetical protein
MSNSSKFLRIAICLLFFITIITMRIPFLSKVLSGEEGSHAALIVKKIDGTEIILGTPGPEHTNSCLPLVGHIDGKYILANPSRNIMPYCILNKVIQPVAEPIWEKLDNFRDKTIFARSIFLGIASIGFISCLALCLLVSFKLNGIAILIPYLLLLYASSTPFLVGASIQPQLDGTIGLALLCTSFLLIYITSQGYIKGNHRFILLLLGGILLSLCKNEWPLAFIVSIFGLLVLNYLLRMIGKSYPRLSFLSFSFDKVKIVEIVFLCIGMAIGISASIALSSSDYFSGFQLMNSVEKRNYSSLALLKNYQEILLPLGYLTMTGIFFTIVSLYHNTSAKFFLPLVYFVFAINIALGFIWSGWLGDGFPRYYAPPTLLITLYLIALLPLVANRIRHYFFIVFILFLAFLIFQNTKALVIYYKNSISITVPGDTNWIQSDIQRAYKISNEDPNAILMTHSSVYFYFPTTNFISRDLGDENNAKTLIGKYGSHNSFLAP